MADDSSEVDEITQVATSQGCQQGSAGTTSEAHHRPSPPEGYKKSYAQARFVGNAAEWSSHKVAPEPAAATAGDVSKMSNQTFDNDSTTNGLTTAPATSDDDFESDDDDDSRSNYSNRSTSNSNSMISNPTGRHSKHGGGSGASCSSRQAQFKGELKRSHHNVLERKRRDLLKDSFAMLRESVPREGPKERISRAEILRQAADFIQSTVKRNASVREELDELIRRNREFDEKRKQQQQQAAGVVDGASDAGSGMSVVAAPSEAAGQLLGVAGGPGGDQLAIKQEL